ncbi:retrovirus-related Pol polyprotein from transposon 17.6 [Trichonephila clavipes]|uniref:Retrovirus-related Pol polyprotein from transposon 17.6 n=1 Tax=Trichonephila clavipes TaxID=2585209 RepID=A0A8X6V674_TRICX|nr:retrovirus-related Pol polyprotein from transposon 17.6 [Trichonephila clavipes]
MDDLVIPAKDEKEGLEKLREVLEVASNKEELPNYIPMRVNKDMAPFYSRSRRRKITSCQYMSQKTTPAEEKYSSYELEVLAVVNALKKFRTYLLGNHFKIITDCSAFQKTMDKKDLVTRVARWTLLLEEYDYDCTSFRPENATSNKKCGKKEGFLNPIPKEDVPLSTYHVDFIGPLPSTNKRYQHILTIIDAFTKFTWLYPVKSTTLEDALDKLKLQQKTFGNPKRIITDRGSPFNSKGFGDYCTEEKTKICRSPPAYPEGTVKWRESTEL